MSLERKRLSHLKRLEKFRLIAKQRAAGEAASAESTLAQLRRLSDRTSGMAQDYSIRNDCLDGAALLQQSRFIGGLQALSHKASGDAVRAQSVADAKLYALATAERRRAAIGDRVTQQEQHIARKAYLPILSARRRDGTDLE